MEEKQINNDLLRLAVITLLIASMFGILQYFPEGKTFDTIGMGVILKVVASTMLYAPFPIFVIYLIILGLNSRYEKSRTYFRLQSFFYDLGIFLTTFIIVFVSFFSFFIRLLVKVPQFPMEVIIGVLLAFVILSVIVISIALRHHFKK